MSDASGDGRRPITALDAARFVEGMARAWAESREMKEKARAEASGDDLGGDRGRLDIETVRAFIFEKLAAQREQLALDPDVVLHFLKNHAEDYWLVLMTRWESVSRDVVEELLREAGDSQARSTSRAKMLWAPLERWEGVARHLVERAVDVSMGAAKVVGRNANAASSSTNSKPTDRT